MDHVYEKTSALLMRIVISGDFASGCMLDALMPAAIPFLLFFLE